MADGTHQRLEWELILVMRSIVTLLVLAVTLSACSGLPIEDTTQTVIAQTPIVQTLDERTLASPPQASSQATVPTQSIATNSTSTPQLSSVENTSIPKETQTPTVAPTTYLTSTATTGNALIADHTVIDQFESIPSSVRSSATAIKTLFMHQSTGANIVSFGLNCMAGLKDPGYYPGECTSYNQNPYKYDDRIWDWQMWAENWSDAIVKTDQWVSIVNAQQSNYQVLGMKLCYVDGWNLDFDYYRQKMEALERAYPDKKFIWATSVLWEESAVGKNLTSAENVHLFNQQLRAYATANNKILYDLADIESHDTNGNPCQSNSFEALCSEYTDGQGGGGGGHPDIDGSIRLAKGFWWLMARISGWNGN